MAWNLETLYDGDDDQRVRSFRLTNTADRYNWVTVTEAVGSVAIMGPGAPREGVTTSGVAIGRLVHRGPSDARLAREFLGTSSTAEERGKLFDIWAGFCRCWWTREDSPAAAK